MEEFSCMKYQKQNAGNTSTDGISKSVIYSSEVSNETVHRKTDKSRDLNIDLLKIIACIFVVLSHTSQQNLTFANGVIYYFCGWSVPVFLMCSGAFLLRSKRVKWKFSLKKIIKILELVFSWCVVIIVVRLIATYVLQLSVSFSLKTLLTELLGWIFGKGSLAHFWYFAALIILYLFLPLISQLRKKQQLVLMLMSGALGVVLQITSYILGFALQSYVNQTLHIWTWIFYFILGSRLYDQIRVKNKFTWKHGAILLLFLTAAIVVYKNIIGRLVITEGDGILRSMYFYDDIFVMLWVSVIFIVICQLKINDHIKSLIPKVSELTTGIYIVHPLVRTAYRQFFPIDTLPLTILYFFVVLVVSIFATAIIYRIPVVQRLVKF